MSDYDYEFQRKRPDSSEIGNDEDYSSIKSEVNESSLPTQEISQQSAEALSEKDFSSDGLIALQDADFSNSSIPEKDSSSLPSSNFSSRQFSTDLPETSKNIEMKENDGFSTYSDKLTEEQYSPVDINSLSYSELSEDNEVESDGENFAPMSNFSSDIPVYNPKLEKEPLKELKENPSFSGKNSTSDSFVVNPNGRSTLNFGDGFQKDNSELIGGPELLEEIDSSNSNTDVQQSQFLINDQITNKNEFVLENGEKVVTTGGVQAFQDLNHQQGEVEGFEGTCGLCSVQCVGNQFGLTNEKGEQLSEKDVVNLAKNEHPPLCVTESDPENNGGTSQEGQQILLEKLGIPAHIESGKSMDVLAQDVEKGKGVIARIEATELWGDNPHRGINLLPRPNHAVTVIDTARDPGTNKLKGFFINDSGNNYDNIGSGRFVSLGEMQFCWQNHGGSYVVTNHSFLNRGVAKWI